MADQEKKRQGDNLPGPNEQDAVHVLTELEHVKVLADPLRLKILESLCEEARTTKQVAEVLGEKPTKLYHHMEALERIGVIRLERTQQKRGTLEKYYRSIARIFRAEPSLFSGPETATDLVDIAAGLLEESAATIRRLPPGGAEPTVIGLRIRAGASKIAALEAKIESWLEEAQALATEEPSTPSGEDPEPDLDYRLTLAFHPVSNEPEPDAGP